MRIKLPKFSLVAVLLGVLTLGIASPASAVYVISQGGTNNNAFTGGFLTTYDGTRLSSASTTAITTAKNFQGVLDVSTFTGAEYGAKITAAYAASSDGGKIILPAGGNYAVSTAITFGTSNKNVILDCQGSTLTYSGTGNMFTFNTVTLHHFYTPLVNCFLQGPDRTGSTVALFFGGNNGSEGMGVANLTIKGFGTAYTIGDNAYLIQVIHSTFINNGKNIYIPAGLTNSGENLSYTDDSFSNDFSPSPNPYQNNCVDFSNDNFVSANFENTSFDNCQVAINSTAALTNVHVSNSHFENPGQNGFPAYYFIHIATTTVATSKNIVTLTNSNFLQDGSSVFPASLIENGGVLVLDSVQPQVGGHIIPAVVTGLGLTITKSLDWNLFYNGATNVNAISALVQNLPVAIDAIDSNGARLFGVDASGHLGAGTSSDATSVITGGGTFPQYRSSNSTAGNNFWSWGITGSGNTIGANAFAFLYDTSSSSLSPFVIRNTGNVGIGTTSPYTLLGVAGQITANNIWATSTAANYFGGSVGIGISAPAVPLDVHGASYPQFSITNDGSGGNTWYFGTTNSSNAIGNQNFAIGNNTSSGANYFMIRNSGLVGISTTSPGALLSVGGLQGGATALFMIASSTSNGLSTTTAFIVDKNGLTGIGTSTPSYQLSVAGKIYGTQGYVFPDGTVQTTAAVSGSSYTATYPVTLTGSAFGLAFGTTTANTWSGLQAFNGNASTTVLTVGGNAYLATSSDTSIVSVGTAPSSVAAKVSIITTRAAGTAGLDFTVGDSGVASSSPLDYSHKVGTGATGAKTVLGLNYYIDTSGTGQKNNSAKNGWGFTTDTRSTNSGDLVVEQIDTSAVVTTPFVIAAATGNVGIATTSPSQSLSIGGGLLIGATAAGGTNGTLTYGGVTFTNTVTGSGSLVGSSNPSFSGTITIPLLRGSSGTGSTLILESTSGVGATDFLDLRTGSQVSRVFVSGGNTVGMVGISSSTPFAQLAVNPVAGALNQFVVGSSTGTSLIITNNGNIGIGTTTPTARFVSVAASTTAGTIQTGYNGVVAIIAGLENATTMLFQVIDQWGRRITGGDTPALSSCGTSPSFIGAANDNTMTIQVGSVAATGCTATFAHAWPTAPSCNVTERTGSITNVLSYTVTTTAVTVTQTGITGDILDVMCTGTQ